MGSFLSTIIIVIARAFGFETHQAVSSSAHPGTADEGKLENLLQDDEGMEEDTENAAIIANNDEEDDDIAMDEGISDMDENPEEDVARAADVEQKDVDQQQDEVTTNYGGAGDVLEKDVADKDGMDDEELVMDAGEKGQNDVAKEVSLQDQETNDVEQDSQMKGDSNDSSCEKKEAKTKSRARKPSEKSSVLIPSISPSKSNWEEDSRRPKHEPEGGVIPPTKKTKMEEEQETSKMIAEQIHFETVADLHFGESRDFECPETLSPAHLTQEIEKQSSVADEGPAVDGSGDAKLLKAEPGENIQREDASEFADTKANVLQEVTGDQNVGKDEAVVKDDISSKNMGLESSENKENLNKSIHQVSVQWTGSARSVFVTGSWVEWKEQVELSENGDNVWSANIFLGPDVKEIELKFIVDGTWVISPDMPSRENNVGTRNNYIRILH